jgi:hypothetical protein
VLGSTMSSTLPASVKLSVEPLSEAVELEEAFSGGGSGKPGTSGRKGLVSSVNTHAHDPEDARVNRVRI